MLGRGKLLFTIGLPRSGKSTIANRWAFGPYVHTDPFFWPPFKPRVIVSGDDFRRALFGRSYQIQAEGTVFAMMDVATRALLDRGFDCIIDETCTTRETLLRYLRLDINAEPVWVNTAADVCIERAYQTGKSHLDGPIQRMSKQLEYLKKNWAEVVAELKSYLEIRAKTDVAS